MTKRNASHDCAIGEAPVEQAVTHKPSPLQTGTEGSVPEGWPTDEMVIAGAEYLADKGYLHPNTTARELFQVMLSVSPPPPVLERQENNHADGNEPVVVEKVIEAD